MRHTPTLLALGSVLAFTLACGGMMPGNALHTVNVVPGTAFQQSWSDAKTGALWMSYDLDHTQDYQVTGSFDLTVDGTTTTYQVDFTANGAPIVGNSGRMTFGTVETNFNGKGSASGQVKLMALEGGTAYDISGTLNAGPGTTVNALSIVATD